MLAEKLLAAWYENNSIPHALLFADANTIMAENYAKLLLANDALFASRNHPDYYSVAPELGKNIITVEQIRTLVRQIMVKPHSSKYNIVLIARAECLNLNAANALLKTLEEPISNTIIMLVTSKMQLLPSTIISRCQVLRGNNNFVVDSKIHKILKDDLNRFLTNNIDPLDLAVNWSQYKNINIMDFLQILLVLLLERQKAQYNKNIWKFINNIYDKLHDLQLAPQLNIQLLLEDLLIRSRVCT
ncbi:MAG: hypothetical protein COB50_02590 [Thiotrichales bacterium]|nr:MAG: hypothetical protein COB50_02590 [Thiotrichales bacterium]